MICQYLFKLLEAMI